ncbi:unnamed protein product [Bursaphelenchus okinawaensis]|uniref:Uncharacterized protein n=1 Tax=Bursaphelenchus okinawaensis TaxID=465554 RepID=A0A811LLC2_9BILA|nr:unnamed protein product [Bursaphelenchus okinawaensis]CAG9126232.1 unnamed protein product [Bursaphelenchus okinawaensis]
MFSDQRNAVTVEFEECSDGVVVDLKKVRQKIANWVREECAFILKCGRSSRGLDAKSVVITDFACMEGMESRMSLVVRWNSSASVDNEANLVSQNILIDVLLAREHLLSTLLDSTLLQVIPSQPRLNSTTTWRQVVVIGVVSVLCSFLFCGLIAACVALNVVGFQRVFGRCCIRKNRPSKELQELNELSRRNQEMNLADWE